MARSSCFFCQAVTSVTAISIDSRIDCVDDYGYDRRRLPWSRWRQLSIQETAGFIMSDNSVQGQEDDGSLDCSERLLPRPCRTTMLHPWRHPLLRWWTILASATKDDSGLIYNVTVFVTSDDVGHGGDHSGAAGSVEMCCRARWGVENFWEVY